MGLLSKLALFGILILVGEGSLVNLNSFSGIAPDLAPESWLNTCRGLFFFLSIKYALFYANALEFMQVVSEFLARVADLIGTEQ